MLKVRIHEPASGFRFWLPVPYRLFINVFLRQRLALSVLDGIIRDIEKKLTQMASDSYDQKPALEKKRAQLIQARAVVYSLDFGELRCAFARLETYKGLVLVDVQASDGTIVHVSV